MIYAQTSSVMGCVVTTIIPKTKLMARTRAYHLSGVSL